MSQSKTTEYKISQTQIPGLLEIDMTYVEDPRGWFQEKYQKQKLTQAGFPENFVPVQQNISYNKNKGVTRGFHAEPWNKYVSVIKGKVYSVFVDLRKENFGKTIAVTIDEKKAVLVPNGVANSFQTLEDDTYYSYLITDHWSQEKTEFYKGVNLSDPEIAANWPIPLSESIVSEKDKNLPLLKDVEPF